MNFLHQTQDDADITGVVVTSFIKGWIEKQCIPKSKTNISPSTAKWGSYFFDLHFVTLFLNASTEDEPKEISETVKDFMPTIVIDGGCIIQTKNFGKVIISFGFALFVDHCILMDRNTLLMLKDTYIGRFHTLFSLQNRNDNKYNQASLNKMTEIYKIGDIILGEGGSSGYNVIKMIERVI